jgi:tRNA(Ile)-lysidine synthetase-like protein
MSILDRVRSFCELNGLLTGRLAVAVSGGVDSVVLLHLLTELGHRPVVISFDHGLRPGSAAELHFVRELAAWKALEFRGYRLDLEPGPALQQRARAQRLAAYEASGCDSVALGHHLDDQVETVLDRLLRGSGGAGLGGMAPRRGRLVRPMLEISRAQIVEFARARDLRWVEDPSNATSHRASLAEELDRLEELRPGARSGLARSARLLAQDEAWLQSEAIEKLDDEGLPVADLPEPLWRRAVLELIRRQRGDVRDVDAATLDRARALRLGKRTPIPLGGWLVRDATHWRCLPEPPEPTVMKSGIWGIWRVQASEPVSVRAPRHGEELDGYGIFELLRHAGIPASLRAYHPVIELVGGDPQDPASGKNRTRRFVAGVYISSEGPTRVRLQRLGPDAVPVGRPFEASL